MIETRSRSGSVVIEHYRFFMDTPEAVIQYSIPRGARVTRTVTLGPRDDVEVFYKIGAPIRTKLNRRASRTHGIPQEEPRTLGRGLR